MEVINTFIGKLFGYNLRYNEEWFTDLVDYDTGKEQRNQVWERPKRHWILPYNVLLVEYRNKLKELCSRAHGIYNVFLFADPYDYKCVLADCSITAITDQVLFQLVKTYYNGETEEWTENKTRIQSSTIFQPIIKVDGATKIEDTDYTLNDDTGEVTFGAAPGAGKVITANYQFYCPVRFDREAYEETTIWKDVFNMGDIPIVEVIE
jgi:uncharacterized protein (TIGR02217 family)